MPDLNPQNLDTRFADLVAQMSDAQFWKFFTTLIEAGELTPFDSEWIVQGGQSNA